MTVRDDDAHWPPCRDHRPPIADHPTACACGRVTRHPPRPKETHPCP